jgi:hypothetical protein
VGISNLSVDAPNVDSYVTATTETIAPTDDIFEIEDENETPDRSSVIQTGWAAAKKAVDAALADKKKIEDSGRDSSQLAAAATAMVR